MGNSSSFLCRLQDWTYQEVRYRPFAEGCKMVVACDMKYNAPSLLRCKKKITAQRKRAHLLHTNQTEMKEAFITLFVVSHFSKMSSVCPFISCQAAAFHVSMQVSLSLWGETQYFHFLTVTVSAFQLARVSLEKCRTLCAIFLLCKASVLLAAKCVLMLIV